MNEKELKIKLGLKIKYYRNKLGITQEQFSEHIGITQRQVSLLELGKSFPKSNTLLSIIKFFDCSLSDLFNFEPTEDINIIKIKLHKMIDKLPDEKLKIIYLIGKNI